MDWEGKRREGDKDAEIVGIDRRARCPLARRRFCGRKQQSLFFLLLEALVPLPPVFRRSPAMSDSGGDGDGIGDGAADAPRAKPMTNADFRALLAAPRPAAAATAAASTKKKDNAGQRQRKNQQQRSSRDGDGGAKYRYVVTRRARER